MPLPRPARRARHGRLALGASLSVAALAMSSALPAQAATSTGWRVVFRNDCPHGCVYLSVSAPRQTSAFAVGNAGGSGGAGTGRPIAAQWRAGAWHFGKLPAGLNGTLIAVSADSPTDAWAVSALNGYVLHWNGTRWYVAKKFSELSTITQQLTGVTAFGRANVWVFGGPGANPGLGTWHFNGRTWQHITSGAGAGVVAASATSPSNMWGVGSVTSPQDAVVHYYSGVWHVVRARALAGLQFNAIDAFTATNVWATATPQTNSTVGYLVHLVNGRWTRISIPWRDVVPARLAGDGHGGLWLVAQTFGTPQIWLLHRTSSGRWSRVSTGPDSFVFGIAQLPGTASLWASGQVRARASIWAYGRLG